ncbi:unnamed protein product [Gongylonema pulchrum]|uniref:Peptidase S1 domain-containing protein n=1 Tax=Gongylonema pulchrum TaxID=637853 RepID=A0A183DEQ4_9BILA|nr:unnamed protein product [Gongylonema pulchrum]
MVRHRCRTICAVEFDSLQKALLDAQSCSLSTPTDDLHGNDLFVITAMSNFCGYKYPLEVIDQIHLWRPGITFTRLNL